MSFFEELKRRNVFRVGIAYTVTAWLLIQVTDIVFPRIGLPDTAVTLVIALLAIGFLPALIIAWAFEMTPDGIKKEKDIDRSQSITFATGRKLDRVIIGIMAVIIAFLVLDRFVLNKDVEQSSQAIENQTTAVETSSEAGQISGPSVAVLPFVNMSGDSDNEYFSDGLTETLLHMLAQLPELRVAARTSSFAFKGKGATIEEIARTLSVAHILEGSVQKAGNRVRITAQLIRTDDGFHVWSQNYDRTLEDIFAIQDEIAKDVAGVLDNKLLGGEIRIANIETSNLDAYDTYLRALEQQAVSSYGSLSNAESLFKQALATDPGFIDAKLGLALNYDMQFGTGLIDEAQMQQAIEPLLSQVREVQPENKIANAIGILSRLNMFNMMDQETIRKEAEELLLLLSLLPTESYIRGQTAMIFAYALNQPQTALDLLETGFLADPLSSDLYAMQGNVLSKMKRFGEARDSFLKAIELNPLDPNHYSRMSVVSGELGDITGVFKWRLKNIQVDPQDHETIGHMAREFYEWGLPEEGDQWAERVRSIAPNSDILQRLHVDRAMSRHDAGEVIAIAEKMIAEPASMRHDNFPTALFGYRRYMSIAGRYEEAYNFLVGLRPEITSYERMPADVQGVLMQWTSIELMTGFRSHDERKAAWETFANNLKAHGPWWFEDPGSKAVDFLFMGDLELAIANALKGLADPLATWAARGDDFDDPIWAPIASDPGIAARLSELKREKSVGREQINEMLQGAEWNQ